LEGLREVERVRVGVIGLGIIGRRHLADYSKRGDVEVVAVADVDRGALENSAKQYNVPHAYTDFRQLLKHDEIQAVDVCLHNNLHAPVAVEALRAGKHVFVEKPLAGSYADGRAMLQEARENRRMLFMQLSTVFRVQTKAAKTIIDQGRLGRIFLARSSGFRRRGRPFVDGYGTKFFVMKQWAGGGALLDMAVYHVGQILYLLGNPKPLRVKGRVFQEMPMNEERRRESGFDVEELGVGIADLQGGITMEVFEAWAANLSGVEGSYVLGSLGGIKLGEEEKALSYHAYMQELDGDVTFDLDGFNFRRHAYNPNEDAFDSPVNHWVAALQGRVQLVPTAEIGLNHLLLAEGIYRSHLLGREVAAEEIDETSTSTALKV